MESPVGGRRLSASFFSPARMRANFPPFGKTHRLRPVFSPPRRFFSIPGPAHDAGDSTCFLCGRRRDTTPRPLLSPRICFHFSCFPPFLSSYFPTLFLDVIMRLGRRITFFRFFFRFDPRFFLHCAKPGERLAVTRSVEQVVSPGCSHPPRHVSAAGLENRFLMLADHVTRI